MTQKRSVSLSERIAARQASKNHNTQTMTEEDQINLDEFGNNLRRVLDVLAAEIAAITQGELEEVSGLYETKARLLKWLELRLPLIEPFAKRDTAQMGDLREDLIKLRTLSTESSELLSRMSVAARAVINEIQKITDRNSLSGLYGKSGQKLENAPEGHASLSREF